MIRDIFLFLRGLIIGWLAVVFAIAFVMSAGKITCKFLEWIGLL